MSTSTVQLMDRLWAGCEADLNAGISDGIFVPVVLTTIIGKQGIDDLATRFSQFIQAKTTSIEDAAHNVTIKRAFEVEGDRAIIAGGPKPDYAPEKKSKLPRPPNAFILYRQRHHPLVKAEHPELHNTQISIVLGTQWKHESEDTKVKFQRMAEALKKKHFKDHPDYQYQPRKPADRKRRMTRRKIAALTTATLPSTEPTSMTSAPVEPAPLPKLAQTEAGNVILDIGNQDLEDETFEQILNEYNQNVQPMWAQVGQNVNANGYSAILSTGVTEEASVEANYYSGMLDVHDQFKSTDELAAEMNVLASAITADELLATTGIRDPNAVTFTRTLDETDPAFYAFSGIAYQNNPAAELGLMNTLMLRRS